MSAPRLCEATGCQRNRRRNGYCETHHYRVKTYGDPLAHIPIGANLGRNRGRKPGSGNPAGRTAGHHYTRVSLPGHPLANRRGVAFLHRVVLHAVIGPGEHRCHWCGRSVTWEARGDDPRALQADHVNGDRRDNHPSNLVPSCRSCNASWIGMAGGEPVTVHPNVRRWKDEHSRRQAMRTLILQRDPRCTLRTKCAGAKSTTVDHIRPLSLGGEPFEPSNCRGACGSCNYARGNGTRRVRATSTLPRPQRVSKW